MPKKQDKKTNSNKKSFNKASVLSEITPNNVDTFAGMVTKAMGNCRFTVRMPMGEEVSALLPGSLRKGPRVVSGNMVFIQISPLGNGSDAYILHIYEDSELHVLKIKKIVSEITKSSVDDIFDFALDEDLEDEDLSNI